MYVYLFGFVILFGSLAYYSDQPSITSRQALLFCYVSKGFLFFALFAVFLMSLFVLLVFGFFLVISNRSKRRYTLLQWSGKLSEPKQITDNFNCYNIVGVAK